ncbi:MAG: MBL fold metallo-hydrolase [Tannerellaceae bacterium]|jgi:phosphoribosyl 1,2-cyclic phosphodiesterase|nr:MBL fold metallo-hydrolase [Tannerellaceae bacterium]
MELVFLSLRSGSLGNCYILGTEEYGIMIDAGLCVRDVKQIMREYGMLFPDYIRAVVITHEHIDHIKASGIFADKIGIPVYATREVHAGIKNNHRIRLLPPDKCVVIEKEVPFMLGDFRLTAFEVPHDSADNVGYFIEGFDHCFTFVTDIGHITPTVSEYACRAHHLILEANYHEGMLEDGIYPARLKKRIAGNNGHLSNQAAAEFLALNYRPHLKDIWLCHLSGDNNHPELARKTVGERMLANGIRVNRDVSLHVLNRATPTGAWRWKAERSDAAPGPDSDD